MKTTYVTLKVTYDPEACDSPLIWDWESLIGVDEYTPTIEVYEAHENPQDAASYT